MAEQKQDDQQEHTHSSYVKIRDVAQKTCQRRWTIGKSGERESGISVLAARHDDDHNYLTIILCCKYAYWDSSFFLFSFIFVYWSNFTLFSFELILVSIKIMFDLHNFVGEADPKICWRFHQKHLAQSAGAVEYTDCISAEG